MLCRRFFIAVVAVLVAVSWKNVYARPNVLFLVVDDLRPKLGCYGESNMVTPNVDNFATKSVMFNRAYVQQAVCSPSRTSFLTGRRPDTTHIFDLQTYFRLIGGNYTTLPQHFKNNGYITQSVGKIFHPGVASGGADDYPYSWSNPAFHAPVEKYRAAKLCPGPDGKKYNYARCPVDVNTMPDGTLEDIQNTDFAVNFLQERATDGKPFFLGLGFHKPHLPFKFPQEYLALYPMSNIHLAPDPFVGPWMPPVAYSAWEELRSYDDISIMNLTWPFESVPLDYQLQLRQSYSAAASYTDNQVGRILSALDKAGLANNTIITFHGDHGWQLGEHNEWCKHTNYDIATRIPMFVYVPGVTSKPAPLGKTFPFFDVLDSKRNTTSGPKCAAETCSSATSILTSDALVEAVDLYATISELAGLDVPPTCPPNPFQIEFCTEGASLVPVIKNLTSPTPDPSLRWKPAVFSQYPRPSAKIQPDSIGPELAMIRIMGYTMTTGDHRYTEWVGYDPKTFTTDWNRVVARELYLHASDPDEDLNLADQPAFTDLVTELSQQLRAGWRKALPRV